jgi:hypothetical protein
MLVNADDNTPLRAIHLSPETVQNAFAYAGSSNSKKIIMITISFLSLPLFFIVLHPERLLSDYLKYLRASQYKIPSITSRVFIFFSYSNTSMIINSCYILKKILNHSFKIKFENSFVDKTIIIFRQTTWILPCLLS